MEDDEGWIEKGGIIDQTGTDGLSENEQGIEFTDPVVQSQNRARSAVNLFLKQNNPELNIEALTATISKKTDKMISTNVFAGSCNGNQKQFTVCLPNIFNEKLSFLENLSIVIPDQQNIDCDRQSVKKI